MPSLINWWKSDNVDISELLQMLDDRCKSLNNSLLCQDNINGKQRLTTLSGKAKNIVRLLYDLHQSRIKKENYQEFSKHLKLLVLDNKGLDELDSILYLVEVGVPLTSLSLVFPSLMSQEIMEAKTKDQKIIEKKVIQIVQKITKDMFPPSVYPFVEVWVDEFLKFLELKIDDFFLGTDPNNKNVDFTNLQNDFLLEMFKEMKVDANSKLQLCQKCMIFLMFYAYDRMYEWNQEEFASEGNRVLFVLFYARQKVNEKLAHPFFDKLVKDIQSMSMGGANSRGIERFREYVGLSKQPEPKRQAVEQNGKTQTPSALQTTSQKGEETENAKRNSQSNNQTSPTFSSSSSSSSLNSSSSSASTEQAVATETGNKNSTGKTVSSVVSPAGNNSNSVKINNTADVHVNGQGQGNSNSRNLNATSPSNSASNGQAIAAASNENEQKNRANAGNKNLEQQQQQQQQPQQTNPFAFLNENVIQQSSSVVNDERKSSQSSAVPSQPKNSHILTNNSTVLASSSSSSSSSLLPQQVQAGNTKNNTSSGNLQAENPSKNPSSKEKIPETKEPQASNTSPQASNTPPPQASNKKKNDRKK